MTIWLSPAEWAAADGAAEAVGVETGALIRHAARSGVVFAAGEVSAGRVRLRARSSRVPVSVAAASEASAAGSEAGRGGPRSAAPSSAAASQGRSVAGDGASRAELFRRATQR